MDKDLVILILLIYLCLGSLVLAIDMKQVYRSFNWKLYRKPFWAGFRFGLYQWTVIILFPIWLIQRLIK